MKIRPFGQEAIWIPDFPDGRFILGSREELDIGQVVIRGNQPFRIIRKLTYAQAVEEVSGQPELALALFDPFFYEGIAD